MNCIWAAEQVPHARTCGGAVGHVCVWPQYAEHSLLAVPAAELVTDDGVAVEAHLDVGTLHQPRLVTNQRHLWNKQYSTSRMRTYVQLLALAAN